MVHPEEQDQSHTSSSEEEPLRRQVSDIPIEDPLGRRLKSQKDEQTIKELKEKFHQEMEQMKERFAKLLLGEDMSGGGKGVSSALALSNAFTNLAASIFGEQRRLEPMPVERKERWRKEIDLLLSVTDYMVEMVPSQHKINDGSSMEVMTTRQRTDIHINIPALRKLDSVLLDFLDSFKEPMEFYYMSNDADNGDKKPKNGDKWWLPTVKVPPGGLSDGTRKFLQGQKDSVTQLLKAAMQINGLVLAEMVIPERYIESLPKNGRSTLGDSIYKSITDEYFDPEQFLMGIDLSSEHKILDLKNKMEASIVIWKRKLIQKDNKSSWSSTVSVEKRGIFEERAETILLLLKHRYPGIPQSTLDISKIQFNGDVGHAVLESYSRVLESLAFTIQSRIEDVLIADQQAQSTSQLGGRKSVGRNSPNIWNSDKFGNPRDETASPGTMTLLDFMGWESDQCETDIMMKKKNDYNVSEDFSKDLDAKTKKLPFINIKKMSYLENLGGVRSPTSRH